MKVGEKVRWYRQLSGHKQSSLAAAAGVSRKEISDIELGKVDQRTTTIESVADGLKRPSTDLTGRPFRRYEIKELKDDELLDAEDLHERLQFVLESKQKLWAMTIAAMIRSIFNSTQASFKD